MKGRKNNLKGLFYLLSFIGLIIGIQSCESKKSLNREDLIQWVETPANGLVQSKEIDNVIYTCYYQPLEYLAGKRLKADIAPQILDTFIKQNQGFHYFLFDITSTNNEQIILDPMGLSSEEYNARLMYLNSMAQHDLKLIKGKDTLVCTQYLFENPYNISPGLKFVLAFKDNKMAENHDLQFVFDDGLLKNGLIKFNFTKSELENIPTLKKD